MLCYYYVATCSKLVHTEDFLLFTYHHVQTEALKMENLNSRHYNIHRLHKNDVGSKRDLYMQ